MDDLEYLWVDLNVSWCACGSVGVTMVHVTGWDYFCVGIVLLLYRDYAFAFSHLCCG